MKHYLKYIYFLFFLILCTPLIIAQSVYSPYFGKNKIMYEKFDWNSYKTEHFNIYYYTDSIQILKNIAEMAESAYQKISTDLKHPLSASVPLIFYKTSTDFQQTNLFQLPAGVLGVAEPILYRIAIQGDMTLDEIQDLIEHELTHIFEYDLLWGSPGGALYAMSQPPLWIMEGLAEYNTDNWSSWSSLIVRDAVLNDRIPELTASGRFFSRYPLPRPPAYDFGHALYDFIEFKHGKNGIREFWHSLKRSPFVGRRNPIRRAFNMKYQDFNHEFKKYLRAKHKDFLLRENPEDYSIPLGPQFPLNPYYFSLSHDVSPSGDIVAVLTQNVKDYDIDIVLISTKDGSVVKNITKGYTLDYEYIKYEIDPSKGKDIAWSSDGDRIAFFARAGQKHSIFILNALTGKIARKIKIPVDKPSSLCFFPRGEELLFTAFQEGLHNIFKINLSTEKILNLTEDDFFEKAPMISPDGTKVAYTIRLDTYDKLFISPLNDLKKRTQLTFGKGNTISPHFSPNSKELYFSGDMRDAYNIYSLNLETGELTRYTDVRTGNFFPIPLPNDPKKVIFASFNKASFQVFKSELEGEVEKTITFKEVSPDEAFKRFEPIISLDIDKKEIKPYKGMGKLYLASRPPIDTIVSTDGSIYGGSALSFSDLFGDYTFFLMAYQVRAYRSYQFSFLNQKRRIQYMVNAFQFTQYYYLSSYYDPYAFSRLTYADATAVRKITGASLSAFYPFNRYYRAQASIGYYNYEEDYLFPSPGTYAQFLNGNILSANFSLIGETTRFKYPYGPIAGNTFKLSVSQALPVSSSFLQNTTIDTDIRKYIKIGSNTLFAFRFKGFFSRGKNPFVFYWGGNNEVRSETFYSIVANEGWYGNLELRFPVINGASTIIGQIGPVRGTLFFDITRSKIKGFPAQIPIFEQDEFGVFSFRTIDAIGSYGYGFQFFFLGFPIHLEFVKRLEFPDISKPYDFDKIGKFKTRFWIGFDF